MEWLKNLSNAIDYIEENLDKEISVDTAAHIACCSTYYFQRMFSYVVGLSLAEYIRKRRMSQAAFELQRTDRKVIDIALKYGYNSPTSFNRAFQKVHGIAPTAAKNNGITLNSYPPIRFSVTITGGEAMPYHIEKKCPMRMIGIRMPLVNDIEINMQNIPRFWKQTLCTEYFKQLCNFHQNEPKGILGVTVYQDPDNIFYYIAVSTDAIAPYAMAEFEIPVATWVVFENTGRFKENVQSICRRFYSEWLPFSGYESAGLPDIEVYPIVAEAPVCGHSEVWIAIKK